MTPTLGPTSTPASVTPAALAEEIWRALACGADSAGVPLVVALDGRSGAGKTTLAAQLAGELTERGVPVTVFHMEDLYQGWQGLEAAVEQWRAISAALAQGQPVPPYTGWDWEASRPTGPHIFPTPPAAGTGQADAHPVLLCEGVGSACGQVDCAYWVQLPDAVRKHRALTRDGATYAPYWHTWAAQEDSLQSREVATYRDIKHISLPALEE